MSSALKLIFTTFLSTSCAWAEGEQYPWYPTPAGYAAQSEWGFAGQRYYPPSYYNDSTPSQSSIYYLKPKTNANATDFPEEDFLPFFETMRGRSSYPVMAPAECERFEFVFDNKKRLMTVTFVKADVKRPLVVLSDFYALACQGDMLAVSGLKEGGESGLFVFSAVAQSFFQPASNDDDTVFRIEHVEGGDGFRAWTKRGAIRIGSDGKLMAGALPGEIPSACAARYDFKLDSAGLQVLFKGSEGVVPLGTFINIKSLECLEESVLVTAEQLAATKDLVVKTDGDAGPNSLTRLFLINRQELVLEKSLPYSFTRTAVVEGTGGEYHYRVWFGEETERGVEVEGSLILNPTGEAAPQILSLENCEQYQFREEADASVQVSYQHQPIGRVYGVADVACLGDTLAFLANQYSESPSPSESRSKNTGVYVLRRGRLEFHRHPKRGAFIRLRMDAAKLQLWTEEQDYVTNVWMTDFSVEPAVAVDSPALSGIEHWGNHLAMAMGKLLPDPSTDFWTPRVMTNAKIESLIEAKKRKFQTYFSIVAKAFSLSKQPPAQFFQRRHEIWMGECVWKYYPNVRFPAHFHYYPAEGKRPAVMKVSASPLSDYLETKKAPDKDQFRNLDRLKVRPKHEAGKKNLAKWKMISNDPIVFSWQDDTQLDPAELWDEALFDARMLDYDGGILTVATRAKQGRYHLRGMPNFRVNGEEYLRHCFFDKRWSYE